MAEFSLDNILKETPKCILFVIQPKKVLLFGSASRGEMYDDNDLDILIIASSVEARYPGSFKPVTEAEFKDALKIAETMVK